MNDTTTAHAMLGIRLTERNILKDLRQILLSTDKGIPSTHVATARRYNTLSKKLCKIKLLGMSYLLFAVINLVELRKYWYMSYATDSSRAYQKTTTNADS